MTSDERKLLESEVERQYKWYDFGSHFWSFSHHAALFTAAILSAASALILKINPNTSNFGDVNVNISASFSAVAALTATLTAAGGFSRKWQANRISRGSINELRIDLTDPDCDPVKIRNTLKCIIEKHDRTILGI
jgi:hypothetical protein